MFDRRGGEPALWVVYELGAFDRRHPAGDVVAMELFGGLPSHFEVIGSSPPPMRAAGLRRAQPVAPAPPALS